MATATGASKLAPSIANCTVPAAVDAVTVTVNVTLSSAVDGFRLEVTVVKVFALAIVKVLESKLPVWLASPS